MKAFLAIVKQTMRSAIRAKVFHVLFVLILLAVFGLPMTVSGDGTANGLVQISLTYSLGIVLTLISTTTLWLACSQLSREIEAYNIHLITAKPCPRWKIWLGKWLGIFLMNAVILLISTSCIFALIQTRVWYLHKSGRFTDAEIQRLDKEIRVGRRSFYPRLEHVQEEVDRYYKTHKAEIDALGKTEDEVRQEIRRRLWGQKQEVAPGDMKTWTYRYVSGIGNELYLRYRIYSGSTAALDQKDMIGVWGVKVPGAPVSVADPFEYVQSTAMGGTFQELLIKSTAIDKGDNNTVTIRYYNPSKEEWGLEKPPSAMFQQADGPVLMVKVASFLNNYCRAIALALLQIAFLAALGCMVSAAFSTPVAAFVAVAYLVIGLSVHAAIDAPLQNDDGSYQYKNVAEKAAHYMARCVGHIVVSVDDLDATSDLARGRLVENARLVNAVFSLFLIRTGLMVALGVWILQKRELGTVIRK